MVILILRFTWIILLNQFKVLSGLYSPESFYFIFSLKKLTICQRNIIFILYILLHVYRITRNSVVSFMPGNPFIVLEKLILSVHFYNFPYSYVEIIEILYRIKIKEKTETLTFLLFFLFLT